MDEQIPQQQPNYGQPQYGGQQAPQQPYYGQPHYGGQQAPQQPYYGQPQYGGQQAPRQPYYGQPYYGGQAPQQPYYRQPYYGQVKAEKKYGPAFGIVSIACGIASLLLFATGINYVLGIAAIVFGILQLHRGKTKPLAVTGIVTGAIGMLLATFFWIVVIFSATTLVSSSNSQPGNSYGSTDQFEEYLEEYLNGEITEDEFNELLQEYLENGGF